MGYWNTDNGRYVRHEISFAIKVAFAWIVLLVIAVPPVSYHHLEFVEAAARPGQIITVKATGIWHKQCPSEITKNWTDEDGLRISREEIVSGGLAEPSDGVETNFYKHKVPTSYYDGSPLPDRIFLQFVINHHCGRFSSFWTTNTTEKIGIDIVR